MPEIHPTAILEGDVKLADDVRIGPHCVITGPVEIGAGTVLVGNVYLHGPLTIGTGNTLYPGVCLGFAPQSISYDRTKPGHGLVIGNDNTFRESVSIHRAMTDEGPTTIGNNNFFMANSHAGHDAQVADHGTFTNGALIAGHVHVGDRVILGGNAGIHQFCKVGRGAMMSGNSGTTLDIPPYFIVTAINVIGGINLIGLRRGGASHEEIDDVRWVYRTLYRRGLTIANALEALRERADHPLVAEYVQFIETSERGICTPSARRRRVPEGATS
jgi:UDP-N-acetylglucosamine acyltransferase